MSKIRIGILGIGGVGGYFGGLLAMKYFNSTDIEIIFIVRNNSEKIIRDNGLSLITEEKEYTIYPDLVSSDASKIGMLDFLICATKSYHLEESLLFFKNCINSKTIILPLLNGIDAVEKIRSMYPNSQVWQGCVYLVSRRLEPGIVKQSGSIHQLYFGSDDSSEIDLLKFEKILKDANIEAHFSKNIELTIWEKFIFISPFASLTTYLNLSIGEVLNNSEHKKVLLQLLNELKSIADEKLIPFPDDIIEKTLGKMERVAPGTLSSMHSDFLKGGKTELESITGYVIKLGEEYKIATPTYQMIYDGIIEKYKLNQ